MKNFKLVLKIIGGILVTLVIGFALFLLVLTITDYNPKEKIPLRIEGTAINNFDSSREFTVLTWNLGYASLGKEADFFMDGGKSSRGKSKAIVQKHIENLTRDILKQDADFIFLQEIDKNATRSFHIDEYDYLITHLTNYSHTFAINYKTLWVPVPVLKPMGGVLGGLAVFSKYKPVSAVRYAFPGNYKWPINLVQLDRCMIETRYPIGSKEFVAINLHMSAFDSGGHLRKQQQEYLRQHILKEYDKGNFVLVGGDWNSVFPGIDLDKINVSTEEAKWMPVKINKNFVPKGWQMLADNNTASCRENNHPYEKGKNHLYIIDGFLISPNIELIELKGLDFNFEDTDHNPVLMKFKLINPNSKSNKNLNP